MWYNATMSKNINNSFTTVTPVSKVLAAVLFIILPFIAFYLGMMYQDSISPKQVMVTTAAKPVSHSTAAPTKTHR